MSQKLPPNVLHMTGQAPPAVPAKLMGTAGKAGIMHGDGTVPVVDPYALGYQLGDAAVGQEFALTMSRMDITDAQKKTIIQRRVRELQMTKSKVASVRNTMLDKIKEIDQEEREWNRKKSKVETWLKLMPKLCQWSEQPLVLEKADKPRLHQVLFAIEHDNYAAISTLNKFEGIQTPSGNPANVIQEAQIFLIQHNWAAAFQKSEGLGEGNVALPADVCAFEFQISGRRVVAIAMHVTNDKDSNIQAALIVQMDDTNYWYDSGLAFAMEPSNLYDDIFVQSIVSKDGITVNYGAILRIVMPQIRCVCIAIEAEVATHELVRQPAQNSSKKSTKVLGPMDYHVVSLSRRSRPNRSDVASGETRRSPRLHFRRSHMRRYPNYTVRIPWTLAGNPELGWIDKHYVL